MPLRGSGLLPFLSVFRSQLSSSLSVGLSVAREAADRLDGEDTPKLYDLITVLLPLPPGNVRIRHELSGRSKGAWEIQCPALSTSTVRDQFS